MLEKRIGKRPRIAIFPRPTRTVPKWKRIVYSVVGAVPIIIILSLFLQPLFYTGYDMLNFAFPTTGSERILYESQGFPFSFLTIGHIGNELFSISFSILSFLLCILIFAGIAYLFMSLAGYAEKRQSEKERFGRISKYFIIFILLMA